MGTCGDVVLVLRVWGPEKEPLCVLLCLLLCVLKALMGAFCLSLWWGPEEGLCGVVPAKDGENMLVQGPLGAPCVRTSPGVL